METHIAQRKRWGGGLAPWHVEPRDLLRHVYVLGQTGTGKSTLLLRMAGVRIHEGAGVGLLDPHGDLAEALLGAIPRRRTDDLVYFNPAGDPERPISINLLDGVAPEAHHLVAAGIVEALRHLYADSWGPRLEWILYNCLRALLDYPDATVLGVPRLLTDPSYRARVAGRVTDPAVRSFWMDEFAAYSRRYQSEAAGPILNKVGQLRADPTLRAVLGQPRKSVDLRFVIDRQRLFIANLAKGALGGAASNLLGSLLVTWFQAAAMGRSALPEQDRTPFYLHLDEFHNFTTESFPSALSEARKFGLSLTLGNQYFGQLSPETRDAVLANAATIVAFRCGADDAETLERAFSHGYRARQFLDLGRYEVLVKTIQRGEPETLRAITLPPARHTHSRRENLLDVSRRKYGRPREKVERQIRRQIVG